MAETEDSCDTFKLPNAFESKVACNVQDGTEHNEAEPEPVIVIKKTTKVSNSNVPLPYTEPEWSGPPPLQYSFEVIKNGTPVSSLKIETSLIVFGRLDICDVIFEHPSVSRYHAVVQYCKGDNFRQKGFYVYDLGSTHGTYLNKEKIKSKIYYKLKVGYILKFGGSTRLHIFQGPEEEQSEEKSVTTPKENDEVLCDWGMGEDAEEDEDLTENPFALSTPNEELYLDDPKKTLRGWFEREGYEVEYNVEEKGFKTFLCRVQLPVDNPTGDFLSVEASVSGKKKEAVVACALEACRTLDRLGLLRQSHHESRQRKKKKWEENDYYDSDEDTFLDRTGTIEKKRELRKKMEKKSEAETFQSIEAKLKLVTDEIDEITEKLSMSSSNVPQVCNSEEDSLEIYMSNLSDCKSDKVARSKLKFRLSDAKKEKSRLEKLLEIARPAKLPPVVKYPGMIGKKLKCKLQLPVYKSEVSKEHREQSNKNEKVEYDSDSDSSFEKETNVNESNNSKKYGESYLKLFTVEKESELFLNRSDKITEMSGKELNNKGDTKPYGLIMPKIEAEKDGNIENIKEKSIDTLPSPPKKRSLGPENKNSDNSALVSDQKDVNMESKQTSGSICHKRIKKKELKKGVECGDVYMTDNTKYSTWVPPKNQSGDGMTHLNAKYGY